jgi:hypothetical protein
MLRSTHENNITVNSAFTTENNDGTFHCNFSGASHLQNTNHIRVRACTLPNMFPNIYAMSTNLVVRDTLNDEVISIQIPTGHYTNPQDLGDAVCAGLLAAIPSLVTCTATATPDGVLTFTTGTNDVEFISAPDATVLFNKLLPQFEGFGVNLLNHVIGCFENLTTSPYEMSTFVALNGVRKVYFSTDKLYFGKHIHPSGNIASDLFAIDLVDTPYGFVKHTTFPQRGTQEAWFASTDCNNIDFRLHDEFGQTLKLPPNQYVDIELLIGYRN